MGRQAWSVRVEDNSHRVEIEHGYWTQRVTVRVDGNVALGGLRFLDMAYDRGVDLPISIDGHSLVVAIRPAFWSRTFLVRGYRFGLTVDGKPAPGSPILPLLAPTRRRGIRSLNAFLEAIAWGAGGAASGRLLVQGPVLGGLLILGAPLLCSLVIRRASRLPGWLRLTLAAGVFVTWVVMVATLIQALGLVSPGRVF